MAHKGELRNQRTGTVINRKSIPMEKSVMIALRQTQKYITENFV